MKNTNLLNVSMLLMLLCCVQSVKAHNVPDAEKKKTYTKTYTIDAKDNISIKNKFGEVKVNGWGRNEVKVEAVIIAGSTTDERAQEILNLISIEDGKTATGVYFNTIIKSKNNGNNYQNEKMEINYQVYMPLSNPLALVNAFGSTVVPDMSGQVDIACKFGKLTAGKLTNVKKVSVEFGSASIECLTSGDFTARFSRTIVNKLVGEINASFEHCSGILLGLDNSTKNLTVKNNFTRLYLNLSRNLSADFDIDTHFGNFKNETDFNIREEIRTVRNGPVFDHRFSGKSGSGAAGMKIKSEFGEIVLGHNLTMDLKEDTKEKKRTTHI